MKRFAAAILVSNGKILLGKRNPNRNFYPGVWDLPGGHCLEHESFREALTRECMEELNIHPLDFHLLARHDETPHFVMEVYVVSAWEGNPINAEEQEHESIAWFSVSEAKALSLADERYIALFQDVEDGFADRPY